MLKVPTGISMGSAEMNTFTNVFEQQRIQVCLARI